jgi:hypothetical protein
MTAKEPDDDGLLERVREELRKAEDEIDALLKKSHTKKLDDAELQKALKEIKGHLGSVLPFQKS